MFYGTKDGNYWPWHYKVKSVRFLELTYIQGVTLGGTGKEVGERHPKVGEGALIGACATILGNIKIGEGAMIAAGSLVLRDVDPHSMMAGTPAKLIGCFNEEDPSLTMNHDATKEFFKHVSVTFREVRCKAFFSTAPDQGEKLTET
ncbi:serine acetyltransferase 4-like isoform X1 [Mercurialis annua]|uniref:serine acetyltransferase 4-like isoform X1 n=1 Tax=Mercurialis annua TaxID=3986 RepID=UPI0024AF35CF|nr:serine acetyltransferase 4-like isoform X1 [Mercurialis annua]